jgi:UDP-2,3-diacylglucosamine pyrophosphatase LpxH
MTASSPPNQTNYLLFSDVHLGGDLVQHARPWTVARLREELRLDRELSSLLEHYRTHPQDGRPWRLIIAGDLVDFAGMSISPRDGSPLETPLTEEERKHGLGNARDHVVHKMRAVAERHDSVFRKLARFVAEGHSLVLIRGNHDVEFYWDSARDAFVDALIERAGDAVADDAAREAFRGRVEFRHWFYYVEDLLYVEHGHQYDETCCYSNVLVPLSPRDPKRLTYSFSDILLRYVVRPTRGLSASGHDGKGLADYLRLAYRMGLGGGASLGYRFFRAVAAMIRASRDHMSERARELKGEHEKHMAHIAERFRVSVDKLRALAELHPVPVTGRVSRILRSVFLDLTAAIAASALLVLVLLFGNLVPALYVAPLAAVLGSGIYAWMKSSRVVDPEGPLRRGAAHVADLLPARFVIMGHTHDPVFEPVKDGVTYINLGAWAVDDVDAEGSFAPPPCTYAVVRVVDGVPHAELRRWSSERGPSLLHASFGMGESGVHLRPDPETEHGAGEAETENVA